MDHLFTVSGPSAIPVSPTGLAAEGLLERQHLQEWVIDNPQVLGEAVLVITAEFDRWADTDGVPARDRLDVLGLDATGRLIVVELKRGAADRDVHLQAITYAALVSRFVANTGNRAVQQQQLRFRFPEGSQVLEAVVPSRPEEELGVVRRRECERSTREAVFTIGHRECGQTVAFRILASGRDAGKWEVIPHNPGGDVGFHERSAERRRDDREHVPAFLSLTFLLFSVPPLFTFLGYIGEPAAAIVSIAFLASIAPHLAPTARALRDFLTRPPAGSAVTISRVDSGVLAFGEDAHIHDVSFPPNRPAAGPTDPA